MLTHGTLQTQFNGWKRGLLIGGEDLRKTVGKRRQGFGNGRQGKRKKKKGGVGGGRQERKKKKEKKIKK